LNAKKHVLVNDPISTVLPEYMETLECAKKNGKFIQSSTMFVHQYRVQRFMNHVLQDDHFGRITQVDASIQLNCDDVEKVGVKLPLRKQDGSIRVLGRFCVLVRYVGQNRADVVYIFLLKVTIITPNYLLLLFRFIILE
jgi:predicted dehydrogenase